MTSKPSSLRKQIIEKKLMRGILPIIFILANHLVGFSQVDNIPISIGIGGGMDLISNKDISTSPLNYSGFGLPIGINGFKMSSHWINQFEVQLTLPLLSNSYPLKSKVKSKLITWARVSIKYQLFRQVGQNNYLGGQIKSDFFYREYDFLDGYAWEFQNSLGASYARKIKLNDKSFILPEMNIPFIGYINRKPSLTFDEAFLDDFHKDGPASLLKYGEWKLLFDDWISVEFDFLYHLELSERLILQSRLGLSYYSINFPEIVKNINIPLRCYINYQF